MLTRPHRPSLEIYDVYLAFPSVSWLRHVRLFIADAVRFVSVGVPAGISVQGSN